MRDTAPVPPISSRYNLRVEANPALHERRAQRPSSRTSGRYRRVLRPAVAPRRRASDADRQDRIQPPGAVEFALKPLIWTLGIWGLGLGILALVWALNRPPAEDPRPAPPAPVAPSQR